MKKFSIVFIAAVMAIGFSAFTSPNKQTTYYIRHNGNWATITPAQACPVGNDVPCEVDNPYTPSFDPTLVYTQQIEQDQYLLEKEN